MDVRDQEIKEMLDREIAQSKRLRDAAYMTPTCRTIQSGGLLVQLFDRQVFDRADTEVILGLPVPETLGGLQESRALPATWNAAEELAPGAGFPTGQQANGHER